MKTKIMISGLDTFNKDLFKQFFLDSNDVGFYSYLVLNLKFQGGIDSYGYKSINNFSIYLFVNDALKKYDKHQNDLRS